MPAFIFAAAISGLPYELRHVAALFFTLLYFTIAAIDAMPLFSLMPPMPRGVPRQRSARESADAKIRPLPLRFAAHASHIDVLLR